MADAPATFRGFIAVALPEPVLDAAESMMEQLRGASKEVRWTERANLHLTLKFLGEVPRDLLPELRERLSEAASASPFEVALGGLGVFPKWARPQVIWAGVTSGGEALAALAGEVDDACVRAGFPAEERPYRAHLTLGRMRPDRSNVTTGALRERAEALSSSSLGVAAVTAFHLVQSTLTPRGAIYTVLEKFDLRGAS
jgi:2'-5' RNA ligase